MKSALELRIPPVVVAVGVALLMWLATLALPVASPPFHGRAMLSAVLAGSSLIVVAAGLWSFRRARTTSKPWRPDAATALVVTGIYRHSRNPMYLGVAMGLLAWGVWLAQPLALLGVPAFVAWMNRFQIAPEERALTALFGDDFGRYCREVRRWL